MRDSLFYPRRYWDFSERCVVLVLAFCGCWGARAGAQPATNWSTWQHDAQRSGRTSAVLPSEPARLWSVVKGAPDYIVDSPVVGPDGAIWVAGEDGQLLVLEPDHLMRWQQLFYVRGPVAIRSDGNGYVAGADRISLVAKGDGHTACYYGGNLHEGPVIGPDGAVYFVPRTGSSREVRKLIGDCQAGWGYTSPEEIRTAVTLDLDGGVLIAAWYTIVRLDGATGQLSWKLPTTGNTSAPAVGPDGAIYFRVHPDQLWAYRPDGSEIWRHTFADPAFLVNEAVQGSPAISSDGVVYVPGYYGYPEKAALVAIDAGGIEQWMYVDPDSSGRQIAPAIDGNGVIVLPAGDKLVGVNPGDGSALWRLDTGAQITNAPAIGDDGRLYVATAAGRLMAFGAGCPERITFAPHFSFRRVAAVGDTIAGHTITSFQGFELAENGLTAFSAGVAGVTGTAAYTESDRSGHFTAVVPGDLLDGQVIESAYVPRLDRLGNVYLPATVATLGNALYVNGSLEVAADAVAPVQVGEILRAAYVDPDDQGNAVIFGKRVTDTDYGLLKIDTVHHAVSPVLINSEWRGITPATIDGLSEDGRVVFAFTDQLQFFIRDQFNILIQSNQTISGIPHGAMYAPRWNAAGAFHYLNAWQIGKELLRYNPDGTVDRLRSVRGADAGLSRLEVVAHATSPAGRYAYLTKMTGGKHGLFLEDEPIAVEEFSAVDGALVTRINQFGDEAVAVNDATQVAFVATTSNGVTALYVGTPRGHLDIDQDGAITLADFSEMFACLSGPGEFATPTCQACDLDESCSVDLADFGILQGKLGDEDCNANGRADILDVQLGFSPDCNSNELPDECDIQEALSHDLDSNGNPDECDPDCNGNAVPDVLDLSAGSSADCNVNAVPDECDLAGGTSDDCDVDGLPDECAELGHGWVYFWNTTTSKLERCDAFGGNRTQVASSGWIKAMAVDPFARHIFVLDAASQSLKRIDENGSTFTVVLTGLTAWSVGLTLDPYNQRLYWCYDASGVNGQIRSVKYDGTGYAVWASGLDRPASVVFDYVDREMYWAEYGTDRLRRARVDGSDVQTIRTTPRDIRGLTVDYDGRRLYWIETTTGSTDGGIWRSNMDGGGRVKLSETENPFDLDIDANLDFVFYASNTQDAIGRAPLDVTSSQYIVSTGLSDPWSLAILEADAYDCNHNGVLDGCDIAGGSAVDCNSDGILDSCLTPGDDLNTNGVPDGCENG